MRFLYSDTAMLFVFPARNLGVDSSTVEFGLFFDGLESDDISAWSAAEP